MRRHGGREVDLETEVGPLRVGLWSDQWVLAHRREGSEELDELFDVVAREPQDLVAPLVSTGMTEQAARALAEELIAERAVMDREEEQGERIPLRTRAARLLMRRR
jgi:hypothetical protein